MKKKNIKQIVEQLNQQQANLDKILNDIRHLENEIIACLNTEDCKNCQAFCHCVEVADTLTPQVIDKQALDTLHAIYADIPGGNALLNTCFRTKYEIDPALLRHIQQTDKKLFQDIQTVIVNKAD